MDKGLNLILFFTYGVSLLDWKNAGILEREIQIYLRLAEKGYRITFFTYGGADDIDLVESSHGITIIPFYAQRKRPKNRWVRLFVSFSFPFKYKEVISKATLIKTNQMSGSWVAVISSLLYGKPLIVRCGFEMMRNALRDEHRPMKWLVKAILFYLLEFIAYIKAGGIIISNKSDWRYIKRLFPINGAKLHLIRNFIETTIFSGSRHRSQGEEKLTKTVLYVGRIIHRKNISNLIQAIHKTEYDLHFIGKGELKPFFSGIPQETRARITHMGVVPNSKLPLYFNRYPVVILPSMYENNPKTLLEAMACERVVIGTEVDGIRELIQDGRNGILCNTDSDSIRSALIRAFSLSFDQKRRIGQAARSYVMTHCSIGNVVKKEMSVHRTLMDRKIRRVCG